MKETVAYCDLDDKDARRPGVAVLSIEIDGTTHAVDVCQPHLTLLRRLPSAAARAGRGRPALKRAPAKKAPAKSAAAAVKATPAKKAQGRKAAVKKVAAKKVAAKKAPAKRTTTAAPGAAGRTPGSRRDQQQRVAAAREWARAQGRTIAGKGRLPAGLLEEFDAASS